MNDTLAQVLLLLERRLSDPEIRKQPKAVAAMLAQDFREFGKSGRLYDRESILELLGAELPQPITVEEFRAESLGPEAALATYVSRAADGRRARRSSVWVYRDGHWQMLFHQGTSM